MKIHLVGTSHGCMSCVYVVCAYHVCMSCEPFCLGCALARRTSGALPGRCHCTGVFGTGHFFWYRAIQCEYNVNYVLCSMYALCVTWDDAWPVVTKRWLVLWPIAVVLYLGYEQPVRQLHCPRGQRHNLFISPPSLFCYYYKNKDGEEITMLHKQSNTWNKQTK